MAAPQPTIARPARLPVPLLPRHHALSRDAVTSIERPNRATVSGHWEVERSWNSQCPTRWRRPKTSGTLIRLEPQNVPSALSDRTIGIFDAGRTTRNSARIRPSAPGADAALNPFRPRKRKRQRQRPRKRPLDPLVGSIRWSVRIRWPVRIRWSVRIRSVHVHVPVHVHVHGF